MSGRSVPRPAAILFAAAVVAACGGGFPLPRTDPTPRPTVSYRPSSFTVQEQLDPQSACVVDPDPAHGGHPPPPAPVVEAGDPTDPSGVVEVTAVGLGDIVLPSSRLLVDDYFAMAYYFLQEMPAVELSGFKGRASVCLHIARFESADQRAAFLHVRLVDEPVARWIIGTSAFGVDGGTGGIGSAEAVRAVTTEVDGQLFLDALEAHDVNTWSWANITTDPVSGANVIGFSTGYGDGGFPVYAGLAGDGRVVSVVIDLLVVPWRWLARIGKITGS
jgi:Protein of unknown function (DUF4241)